MVTGKISFSVVVDLDEDYSFTIEVSKPGICAQTSFWGQPRVLVQFGSELADFPQALTSVARFEVGNPARPDYPYLLLEAHCYSPGGQSAIRVLAWNGEPEPHRHRLEFSIPAEAASLNRLGNIKAGKQLPVPQ